MRNTCCLHKCPHVFQAILSVFCQDVTDNVETAALLMELDEDEDIPALDEYKEDSEEDGDELAPEVEGSNNGATDKVAA